MKRRLTYMSKNANSEGMELELAQCTVLLVWSLSTVSCAEVSNIRSQDRRQK
jgi:hypothetical protein